MPRTIGSLPADDRDVLLETWEAHVHATQSIVQHLDPLAWRAEPAGKRSRTIAAIYSHVHNVRCKWVRLSAPQLKVPSKLDHSRCTQAQAFRALATSGQRCSQMLAEALRGQRVQKFRRDGYLPTWPAGASMFAYMFAHELHHRGQVTLLAHQAGHPLPGDLATKLWHWEKLWKESGFETRPR